MLGFVASSLIPSLTYCCTQLVLDRDYGADDQVAMAAPAPLGRGASPALAASLCASAITMFTLSAWKRLNATHVYMQIAYIMQMP